MRNAFLERIPTSIIRSFHLWEFGQPLRMMLGSRWITTEHRAALAISRRTATILIATPAPYRVPTYISHRSLQTDLCRYPRSLGMKAEHRSTTPGAFAKRLGLPHWIRPWMN